MKKASEPQGQNIHHSAGAPAPEGILSETPVTDAASSGKNERQSDDLPPVLSALIDAASGKDEADSFNIAFEEIDLLDLGEPSSPKAKQARAAVHIAPMEPTPTPTDSAIMAEIDELIALSDIITGHTDVENRDKFISYLLRAVNLAPQLTTIPYYLRFALTCAYVQISLMTPDLEFALNCIENAALSCPENITLFDAAEKIKRKQPGIIYAYKTSYYQNKLASFNHGYSAEALSKNVKTFSVETLNAALTEGLQILLFRPSVAEQVRILLQEKIHRLESNKDDPYYEIYSITEKKLSAMYFTDNISLRNALADTEIRRVNIILNLMLFNTDIAVKDLAVAGQLIYDSHEIIDLDPKTNFKYSVEKIEKAKELSQLDPDTLYRQAFYNFNLGKIKQAKAIALEVIAVANEKPEYYKYLSLSYFLLTSINMTDKKKLALTHLMQAISYDTDGAYLNDAHQIKNALLKILLPEGPSGTLYRDEDIKSANPLKAKILIETGLRTQPLQSFLFFTRSILPIKFVKKYADLGKDVVQEMLCNVKIAIWLHKKPFNHRFNEVKGTVEPTTNSDGICDYYRFERDLYILLQDFDNALVSHTHLIDNSERELIREKKFQLAVLMTNTGIRGVLNMNDINKEVHDKCIEPMYHASIIDVNTLIRDNKLEEANKRLQFIAKIKSTDQVNKLLEKVAATQKNIAELAHQAVLNQQAKKPAKCVSKKDATLQKNKEKLEQEARAAIAAEAMRVKEEALKKATAEIAMREATMAAAEKKAAKEVDRTTKKNEKNAKKALIKTQELAEMKITASNMVYDILTKAVETAERQRLEAEETAFQAAIAQNTLPAFKPERLAAIFPQKLIALLLSINSCAESDATQLKMYGSIVSYITMLFSKVDPKNYRPGDIDLSIAVDAICSDEHPLIVKLISEFGFEVTKGRDGARFLTLEKPLTKICQEENISEDEAIARGWYSLSINVKFNGYRESLNPFHLARHSFQFDGKTGLISLDKDGLVNQSELITDIRNQISRVDIENIFQHKLQLIDFFPRLFKLIRDAEKAGFKLDEASTLKVLSDAWLKSFFCFLLTDSNGEDVLEAQKYNCYRDMANLISKQLFSQADVRPIILAFVKTMIAAYFSPGLTHKLPLHVMEKINVQSELITTELQQVNFDLTHKGRQLMHDFYDVFIKKLVPAIEKITNLKGVDTEQGIYAPPLRYSMSRAPLAKKSGSSSSSSNSADVVSSSSSTACLSNARLITSSATSLWVAPSMGVAACMSIENDTNLISQAECKARP